MKGLKQCIAIMLALVMAFYTVSLDAIAAGISNDTTQISVENKNVKPGDTFNVEVKVKNNPGILGATLKLSYDSGLTLKNVEGVYKRRCKRWQYFKSDIYSRSKCSIRKKTGCIYKCR